MLFRLLQDLKEFRKEEERVRDATKQIADSAAAGPLARVQRRALKALSADQTKLRARVDERQKAIAEEGSFSFVTQLEGISVDMAEVARLLEEEQHDAYVRGLEDEILHAISDLIGGFEDEIARRQEPPKEGQPGQQGKPLLVPPTVEIKLMRRVQVDLNAKIESIWRSNPGLTKGQLDDRTRRTLERLYNQQARLADDLEKLMKSVFGRRDQ